MLEEVVPKIGDFGLVNIKGEIGWEIRLGQWLNGDGFNPYEHAFIYIGKDANGVDQVFEAEPEGARIAPLSEYKDRHILWSTDLVPLTDDERQRIVVLANQFVGTPYGFYDYLVIALYRLHIRFPFIADRVRNTKTMICSQAVADIFDSLGVKLTDRPPFLVTPASLANYLVSFKMKIARLSTPS